MTFPVIMVSLYICIFVVGVSLLAKIIPSYRRPEVFWLILFVMSVCVISFCSLNVYVADSFSLKTSFSRWRFVGHGIIAPTWFFFFMQSFSKAKIFRSPFLIIPLSAIMIVTVSMAIIPGIGDLLVGDYAPIRVYGANLVKFSNGPWFMVHIVIAYLCAFFTIGFALVKIPFFKGFKRKQLITLSIGVITGVAVDLYCVYTNSPLRWAMLSGGAYLITEGSILYAVSKHSLFELSSMAKNQVFHGISDPILILDRNKVLVESNENAKALFKLSESDNYKPLESLNAFEQIDLSVKEQSWTYKGDETYHFKIISESLKTYSGKILFFHNITAQKEVEKSLNSHLDFKAKLLGMMAHDFSGILSAQGQLSAELEKKVSPELRENATSLSSATQAGKDLLQNILLWSRAQENRFIPEIKPYEINVLLQEVVNNLESVWKLKKLQIEIKSQAKPLVLNGDTVMVESIIRNILTNSIRASYIGGKVTLSLTKDEDHCHIEVIDRGSGMNPGKLQEVQNSEKGISNLGTKSSEGFGLGLVIARRFVDMHKGQLEFKSKEKEGTLVTLSLPLQVPSS